VEPETPSAGTLLRRAPAVIEGELPEETVLLRTDTGDSVRLNATAAWLWGQLASPQTLEQLGERLGAEFGIDGDRARADAAVFARSLGDRGFLAGD
jgi:Coenzyme PQQ synthesis protein D (PqqD)